MAEFYSVEKYLFLKKSLIISFTFLMVSCIAFGQENEKFIEKSRKEMKEERERKEKRERKKNKNREKYREEEEDENDEYDNAGKAFEFEIERTKDPVTGKVPRHLLVEAMNKTRESQEEVRRNLQGRSTTALSWIERGSNSDAVGGSNGNTRANGGITSGRMRAIWADLSDATGNTVWVGGVDGGLWKTTNITASPATWTVVNDYLSNLAVTGICQDPTNNAIMYFCTGEAFNNADAVNGNGVFKSTNSGATWTQLSSTSSYTACTKILCDAAGNVYLSTVGFGLRRSTDGGTTWTAITPTGLTTSVSDFEISSTGRLHVSCGLSTSANGYRFTDIPATVTASGWTSPTTGFTFPTGSNSRVELACVGNVLYAAISNNSAKVATVAKSIDGGANWSTTTLTSTASDALNGTNSTGQAWYCLTAGIDPSNTNNAMLGNLNIIKTTDGGTTWTKASEWVGTSGQYVHADQHVILWYNNGNKLLFGTDGGIHYSADKGVTIRDRNVGLRIKQFYSVAIHPSSTNYFLAGAQDNGTHQFSNPGLSSSVEVTGGDGAFVAIDQNQPQYQFGAYVYQRYRRSTNSGSTWSSINFYKGTSAAPSDFGRFINPYAYDNTNDIIYAAAGGSEIFRWTTPLTTGSGSYYASETYPTGATILTGISSLSGTVSAVHVSPYTANRVYFGSTSGKLIYIDNAHTAPSSTLGTVITGSSFPTGNISCVNTGTSDQNLIVCFSNYSVSNIWVSTNGGTSWTAIDGNLPNIPVRWAMFYPGNNTKAIIATETGVWETDLINGSSTVWTANPTFPVVRTDMLAYRSSDGTIAAATHGRGLFTSTITSCPTPPTINVTPSSANYCSPGGTAVSLTASGAVNYTWSPPDGLSATSGANVTASPTSTTVYTVTGIDGSGCSGIGNTTITVVPSFTLSASATPSDICSGGSSVLSATPTIGSGTYCQPTYTSGTSAGDYIGQVSIATTTLNNITTGAASPYYTLFPASGSTTGTLTANTLYTMTVKGGTYSTCYIRGWIDFNNDGEFTSSETIGISGNVGSSTTGNIQFTIPLSALNGTTRLRLRSSDTNPGPGSSDFCGATNSGWGETEDYTITITGGTDQFTYLWSPSTFLSSNTTNPTTANGISSNTTYTVIATSSFGCTASAQTSVTISIPAAPSATNGSRCGTGTVDISAGTIAGHTIDWYAASTGGIALSTGNTSFTTPSISSTTVYYAEARNIATGCISATRTAVTATVNTVPALPTAVDGSRCGTGTVNISATTTAGHTIDWYAGLSGGTALSAGSTSFTTPSISTTTVYYAEARNTTTSCISSTRTAVTATVNTVPAAPSAGNGSRCGTGTVNISATTTGGHTIDWYAAATGGSTLSAGSTSYTTPSISTTTIYYAEARNTTTGCISSTRTAVTATVNTIPAAPSAGNASRCGTGTVNISATTTGGHTIDWYAAATGGSPLSSGSTSFTTPSISTTTVYYAEARNTTTGCISATRTAVTATVNTVPPAPSAGNASRCGTGTVTISATTTGGHTIDWYGAATGGSPLSSGSTSYTTPSISTTTAYYAEARNTTTGCLSATRVAVTATINAVPAEPSAGNASRCGTGTVTISATTTGGHTIDWYAAATGGSPLSSGFTSFTTPSISTTTVYYAEARNTTTGCISATRAAVTATVNTVPAAPTAGNGSRCGTGAVNISATTIAGHTIDWYAASTGGAPLSSGATSYTTPGISTTTVYYAEARNTTTGCLSATRTAVTATINTVPAEPSAGNASRCGTGTVNISATTTGGLTIDWYAAPTGGSPLSSGSTSYTTPSISTTTVYYAEARNTTTGCLSATRTAITATVNAVPTEPTAGNGSRCGTGTVNISATTTAGHTIDWYTASTGGAPLSSGATSYTTPSISTTTVYYAEARNTTTGCVSTTRAAVTATVNPVPAEPTAINGSRCGTGTVNISATTTGGHTIDWYAAATGGTALSSGSTTFTTPGISATTIYYAEARNTASGCLSATRTAVTATVNNNPATPSITPNGPTTFCSGNSVTLTSSSSANNTWSTSATTQSIVVTTGGNYTVTITDINGCQATSAITPVTVNPCAITLNLKFYLEGYYVAPSVMIPTLYELGISTNPTETDTVTVNLWSTGSLQNSQPDFSQKAVLKTDGTLSTTFSGVTGTDYYIAIKHRNSVETWSAVPVNVTPVINYDFSTGVLKAYGDGVNPPMKFMGSNVFAFYSGDINQDGTVDGLDLSLVENDAFTFAYGYNSSDITGDGATDAVDQALIENNAKLFLFYARPYQGRHAFRWIFSRFKK